MKNQYMRIFNEAGENLGDTPIVDWEPADGSYGLLDYLAEEGVNQDSKRGKFKTALAEEIESNLLRKLSQSPNNLAVFMGFSAVLIEE